MFVAIAEIELR